MSYPNDAPAAAWYPDPQSPGHVRWWDGTNWTDHVSVPAPEVQAVAIESAKPHEEDAEPMYIGRHAAGPNPAPRQTPSVPPIRPRERVQVPVESLLYA